MQFFFFLIEEKSAETFISFKMATTGARALTAIRLQCLCSMTY